MNQRIIWLLRAVPALILLQTLYFKFTAAPESVYIFSTLGMEPYGRIGIGIAELITAGLLMIPATTWLGACLCMGILSGAIFFHLTTLGIEVMNDGGLLFALSLITFICAAILVWLERKKVPFIKRLFAK